MLVLAAALGMVLKWQATWWWRLGEAVQVSQDTELFEPVKLYSGYDVEMVLGNWISNRLIVIC